MSFGEFETSFKCEKGTWSIKCEASKSDPKYLRELFESLTVHLYRKVAQATCPHVPDDDDRCTACGQFVEE